MPEHLYNLGLGSDVTSKNWLKTIQQIVGHKGNIEWDSSKPDGTSKKLMDSSKMNALGWNAKTSFEVGITATYDWFFGECKPV